MIDKRIKFKREPYGAIDGKPLFIIEAEYRNFQEDLDRGIVNRLKNFFKNFPAFYDFLFFVINPALFLGKSPKTMFSLLPPEALIVDVGSGSKKLHERVVSLDISPWKEVYIVASAFDLPFADGAVDGGISTWTIEHFDDPGKAVSEMKRVLKKGGQLFLSTNFVFPYHPSPQDYYRWSKDGLRELLKDFEELEIKPSVGPTSALLAVFQEWIAVLFSFNIKQLKDVIWILAVVLTFPVKFLDLWLIRYKTGESIAGGFYYIGRKK